MKYLTKRNFISIFIVLLFLLGCSVKVFAIQSQALIQLKTKQNIEEKKDQIINSNEKNSNFEDSKMIEQFRFKGQNIPPSTEQNDVMLNSEVLAKKPPSESDQETRVFPESANAGTEFSWGFLLFNFSNFNAKNCLIEDGSYWLSQKNVQQDHWEAVFSSPQKIDVINIKWRLPPKRFKVWYKLDDSQEFIPATEVFDKSKTIVGGQLSNQDVGNNNAIVFHKSMYAKRVRINLNEPLKKKSFSIFSVTFYQRKSVIIVKNELLNPCENYCWYVNTDKPRVNVLIEAFPCINSVVYGDGNELFTYDEKRVVRQLKSNLCAGFGNTPEVVLKNCKQNNPPFTIQPHADQSLFFTGYEEKCIYIDDSKRTSANFISKDTEVIITSQADNQTYKKENIKFDGENYWHSTPGQKKITLQFLFGKIKGITKDEYESKRIDTIVIHWIREPRKFMIYTWKPGFSWTLIKTYNNFRGKKSEIKIYGQFAAAIMIILDQSYLEAQLGNLSSYAIQDVYIGTNSMKIKIIQCNSKILKYKLFDFTEQSYRRNENTGPYLKVMKNISQSFEKLISTYKNVKFANKYVTQSKEKAVDFLNKLKTVRSALGSSFIKKIQQFQYQTLRTFKNSRMQSFVEEKREHSFESATTREYSGNAKLGTKHLPAEDCLQIKKLRKNILSGFYFIKPECSPKALRVFCDFQLYADAVDIYLFNNYSDEPNPDLNYLGLHNFRDIRYQCSKVGLYPIQLHNKEMVNRIYQLLVAVGYDLTKPITIPLGYDYSCKPNNTGCSLLANSLNDKGSPPINTFFISKNEANLTKPGPFAGLGYSSEAKMIFFDSSVTVISGIMCSTNHFKSGVTDDSVKTISCEMNVSNNGDIFVKGSEVLIKCPSACHQSKGIVYGAGIYHADSAICVAAIHAGLLTVTGGKVFVIAQKSQDKYQGSNDNGIKTQDLNQKDGKNSFTLKKYEPTCPIDSFNERKEEIQMDKEISFLETKNLEENFIKLQNNMKIDPNEFDALDSETLKKFQNILINHNKENIENEDYEYNKLHDSYINKNKEFKFVQQNLPEPVDPTTEVAQDPANSPGGGSGNNSGTNSTPTPSGGNPVTDPNANVNNIISGSGSSPSSPTNSDSTNKNPGAVGGTPEKPSDPTVGTSSNQKNNDNTNAEPIPDPADPESNEDQEQSKNDNKRCKPVTDDGIVEMKTIRKAIDWDFLDDLKIKNQRAKSEIFNFRKNLSWSQKNSKLSNYSITIRYHAVASFKAKVQALLRKLGQYSEARIQRTRKLILKWDEELDHLTAQESFFLNYASSKTEIFYNEFEIFDAKCDIKSNWDIFKKGIKGRTQAIGVTSSIFSNKQVSASMFQLRNKKYFDFTVSVDILCKADGKAGVVFRVRDMFNYYAFVINKSKGYKAIVKVIDGRKVTLKKEKDGGILLNDWHTVNIKLIAGNIRVFIYDNESTNKASSEKSLEVTDYSFVSGSAGVFVNKMEGFFFDKFSVVAHSCWTPWTPMKDLDVTLINSNVFIEEFRGTIVERFYQVEIGEGEKDGPADWTMNYEEKIGQQIGISQHSLVFDSSEKKTSAMLLYKNLKFRNGNLNVCFDPDSPDGMVSVIFKHKTEKTKTGVENISYYSFDMIHSTTEPKFVFKKYSDGVIKVLNVIDKPIFGLEKLGYIPKKMFCVFIEYLVKKVTIKVSINGFKYVEVMTVEEDSIKSGTIGLGTFKTSCRFYKIELFPPKLELSEADKNFIMTTDTDKVPFPDSVAIHNAASFIVDKLAKSISTATARGHIIAQATTLSSTLGLDFSKSKSISIFTKNKSKSQEQVANMTSDWKVCVASRTKEERFNFCERTFHNEHSLEKCSKNFCVECCESKAPKERKNIVHICVKTCNKSLQSENSNEDYKDVCINSENPVQNIYAYCTKRLDDDKSMMKFCKLDMCNLCCVFMDPMRKQNYSYDNMKNCFRKCSDIFNIDEESDNEKSLVSSNK